MPDVGLQLSSVHGLPSSQFLGEPDLHAPPPQMSPPVHASPSLHAVVLGGKAHLPPVQLSSVQGFASLQSLGLVQLPPQLVIGLNTQLPLLGSHASLVHASASEHTMLAPTLHAASLHTSPIVHASPSLQVAALATWPHTALLGSQVSLVQGF